MLRRSLAALLAAILLAGALPLGVLAATPTASAVDTATGEDMPVTITLTGGDSDLHDISAFAIATPPAHGSVTDPGAPVCPPETPGACSVDVVYTPSAGWWGTDSFTFTATGQDGTSGPALVTILVAQLNDAPTFTPGGDVTVDEDSGPYSATWATAIGPGDAYETGQTLTWQIVDVSNPALFQAQPQLALDGTLTFESKYQWSGTSTVTVRLHDNGGTETWGVAGAVAADTSAATTFTITVNAVNDAPTPSPASVQPPEDGGAFLIVLTASDVEGDAMTGVGIPSGPAHGTLDTSAPIFCDEAGIHPRTCTIGVLYTPDADYNGPDAFTWTATDGTVSSPATVTIDVTPVNDPPGFTPGPSTVTVAEDSGAYSQPWATAISAGPANEASQTVDFIVDATNPTLFSAGPVIASDGTLTFTPAANAHGTSTVTVQLHDDGGLPGVDTSAASSFDIVVTSVNDPPVANAQEVTTDEDTAKPITLTGSDVETPSLAYTVTTPPGHGRLTGTAPSLVYTPDANWNGTDAFAFTVNDGTIDSAPATVTVHVTAVNDAPVCTDVGLDTDKNVAVGGTVGCSDVDHDPLTLRVGTGPLHGAVTSFDAQTGAFTYTPDHDVTGTDTFTVIAADGQVDSAPATVRVSIANHAPVCTGAAPAAADEDTVQSGTLSCADADGDPLTYSLVTDAAHGHVVVGADTGAWTYTPAADFNGTDSFTFRAGDGAADSAAAAISLVVTRVNDSPVANAQAVTTDEEAAAQITLTGSDVEGAALAYEITVSPAHGVLAGTAPNLTYTPATNYNGPDAFAFTVNDGTATSAPATVSITVVDVNDPPVAKNDVSGIGGFPYVRATVTTLLPVLLRDTAGAGDTGDSVHVLSAWGAAKGRVTVAADGSGVLYNPSGCATGTDTFTYTVEDSHGATFSPPAPNVLVTISRPGTNGLSSAPITDTPSVGIVTGGTLSNGVPVKVAWCAATRSGSSASSYRLDQSGTGGSTWSNVSTSLTARSATRYLRNAPVYRWRVRTKDTSGRTGNFSASAVTRSTLIEEDRTLITYSGAWGSKAVASASSGRLKYASSTSSSAAFTAPAGTRQVAIVGPKGAGYGSFRVWIDGAWVATVAENATSGSSRRVLWVANVDPATAHDVVLRPASTKRVYLDAVVTLQ